ncbi:RTA1 like protein-domain-containing protein [Schizophyllum commune]
MVLDQRIYPYGYIPTEYVCIIFLVLFSISTAAHLGQAIWYRMWWLIATTVFCGILEIMGWAARLWSSRNPSSPDPFEMQIVCTILGPTPLLAAQFIISALMISRLGHKYSRFVPKIYTSVFFCCDIIALVIQAVGGGMAATALDQNKDADKGGNIMLGGICFQLAVIVFFIIVSAEYVYRYANDSPAKRTGEADTHRGPLTKKMLLLFSSVSFVLVCLFIRSIYRTIELSDGWTGRIITTEVYFNVLDGAMIVLAMFALNFFHPGMLLLSEVEAQGESRSFKEYA